MSIEPEAPEGSARKQELLRASLEYAAANGLSDLSLRPLAKAIGSSPRVLLYLFGSKTGLLSDVLALNRAEQQALLREAAERDLDARESLQLLFDWIVDPARTNLRRLFFEAYIRSAGSDDESWHDFARRSVDDWLDSLQALAGRRGEATLALAVIRGLVLDLLATNDLRRIQGAWKAFLDTHYPAGR